MAWPVAQHCTRLALALLAATLAGAICSRATPPLVLSGDERLSDGPISIDQNALRARSGSTDLQLRGTIMSALSWPLSGTTDVALRDLEETPIASGHGEFAGNGTAVAFDVAVTPSLRVDSEDEFARYVLHVAVTVNGYRLQLRRSLYMAVERPDAEVMMPAQALAGAPLPVVAVQSPIADRGWLRALTIADSSADEITLAVTEFDTRGAAATLVPVPAEVAAGTALAVESSDAERRHRMSTGTRVVTPESVELRVGGDSVAPDGTVDVVAAVRAADQTAAAQRSGQLCLGLEGRPAFTCHPVTSDAAGVAATRFAVSPALAAQQLSVSAQFATASASTPVVVAATPAIRPLWLELADPTATPDNVAARVHAIGNRPGQSLHTELRLDHAQGPLVAESDGALATAAADLRLPTPPLAQPRNRRWSVLAGVADPFGRRSAAATQLYAGVQGLAVGVALPDSVVVDEPFAAAVIVRDVAGALVSASGILALGREQRAFSTIAPGIAALGDLVATTADAVLEVTVDDGAGRTGAAELSIPVAATGAPLLVLTVPPVVPGSGQIDIAMDTVDLDLVAVWTTVAGIALDANLDGQAHCLLAAQQTALPTTTTALAVDRDSRLHSATRLSLAPPPAAALELLPAADQTLIPVVRDRSGANQAATVVIDRRQIPLPASAHIDVTTARTAVEQLAPIALQAAVVRAVDSEVSERSATLTANTSPAAIAISQLRIVADLDAIAGDISDRLARQDLTAAELPDWVQRRSRVYYDPWGQPYRLELRDGRLWLTSNGLDEQAATADDAYASRYLHDVLLPVTPPELPVLARAAWATSIMPATLAVVAAGNALPDAQTGDRITARTADGTELVAVVTEPNRPRLELIAPALLSCRRNDRFEVPVTIVGRRGRAIALRADSSDPTALVVVTPQPIALLIDADGVASLAIELRVRSNAPSTLVVSADDGERSVSIQVQVQPADVDQDQVVLAAAARRLELGIAQTVEFPSAPTGSRRDIALRAQLFADAAELASATRNRALARPAETVAEVRVALEAAAARTGGCRACDQQLAQLAVRQTAEGGLAVEVAGPLSTDATLDAIEAMLAAEQALAAPIPLLGPVTAALLQHLDADGGLSPSTGVDDAVNYSRMRLRTTARLARLLALQGVAGDGSARVSQFVREHQSEADDALTLAQVLRALVIDPLAAADVVPIADALRARQQFASATTAHDGVFAGLPGDGADSDLLATALALVALREAGVETFDRDAALAFLVRSARPDLPALGAPALGAWLAALAPFAGAAPAHARITLDDGQVVDVDSTQATAVAVVVATEQAQAAAVELTAGAGAILLLWTEGEPAAARADGPALRFELPALSTLAIGEVRRVPLTLGPLSSSTLLATRNAPCLDVAIAIDDRTVTASADGQLRAAIAARDPAPAVSLVLWATCRADLSLPIVRATPISQPWLESATGPRLVQIR